jgi:hypothetical protein
MSKIKDLVVGSPYEIQRRVTGVPAGGELQNSNLIIKLKEETSDGDAILNIAISEVSGASGHISDNGSQSGVANLKFSLTSVNTGLLQAKKTYYYKITVFTDYAGSSTIEEGELEPLEQNSDLLTATSTSADALGLPYSPRVQKLVNVYLDSILHDFRQLRVWDERVRRSGNDPRVLQLTYGNWNWAFPPQVYDINNDPVSPSELQIDYKKGHVLVASDNGHNDYFITYEFNLFPSEQLLAFLELSLMEINSTAEPGTHLTAYETLDAAPLFWDGPLVYGAAAKAFRRMHTDGSLWRNFMIWQEGNNGSSIASEASTYYQTQFDDLRKAVKRAYYLAGPTGAYDMFRNTGFGGINPYSGKFRGLRINKMSIY